MKLQNRLKSYTVVLLLSPLLFLGSLNGETGRRRVRGQYLNHLLIGLIPRVPFLLQSAEAVNKAYLYCRNYEAVDRACMMYSMFGACKVL